MPRVSLSALPVNNEDISFGVKAKDMLSNMLAILASIFVGTPTLSKDFIATVVILATSLGPVPPYT